jgi:hypothetical protein
MVQDKTQEKNLSTDGIRYGITNQAAVNEFLHVNKVLFIYMHVHLT